MTRPPGAWLTAEQLRLLREQQKRDGLVRPDGRLIPYFDFDYVWRGDHWERVAR